MYIQTYILTGKKSARSDIFYATERDVVYFYTSRSNKKENLNWKTVRLYIYRSGSQTFFI